MGALVYFIANILSDKTFKATTYIHVRIIIIKDIVAFQGNIAILVNKFKYDHKLKYQQMLSHARFNNGPGNHYHEVE